jgi:sugar phosphate isomerase/epimerase
MNRYRYFLAIQTLLPDNYRGDSGFIANMRTLGDLGFDGVELNIRDPQAVKPQDLKDFLGDFGLVFSAFATGFTAKTHNLSLAAAEESRRKESVRRAKEFLAFAAELGAGAVAGFLKGAMGENSAKNLESLKASAAEIAPEALRLKTPFIVEAINRFESPLGNSLDGAWDIIRDVQNPFVHILPDTWHMNMEESNMEAAMIRHRDHFISFHLSDNNRFLPGFGALDFKKIIGVLDALEYKGKVALEANLKVSFIDDVTKSMEYLAPLLAKEDR